jgi:hypothetical protein
MIKPESKVKLTQATKKDLEDARNQLKKGNGFSTKKLIQELDL